MIKPDKAFILAAGKGTRLRPVTDSIPKPMVDIAGKSIIKRTLEKLADESVGTVVVNLHYLSDTLQKHLTDIKSPHIVFSHESDLLETGGGLKNAIHHFNAAPFFIINGDALWDDGADGTALSSLSAAWDDDQMDLLLLLQPTKSMDVAAAVGDYHLNADGSARRSRDKTGDYMFTGLRIAHPRLFENTPDGPFSFLDLMDRAEQSGRLFAIPHTGNWYHISTPEDLKFVNELFSGREK